MRTSLQITIIHVKFRSGKICKDVIGIKISGFQKILVQYSSLNANIQVASLIEIITKSHTALKKEDIYINPIFILCVLCGYCAINKFRLVNIPIILQSYHLFIVGILKPILSVSIKYTLLPTYVTLLFSSSSEIIPVYF